MIRFMFIHRYAKKHAMVDTPSQSKLCKIKSKKIPKINAHTLDSLVLDSCATL